MNLNKDPESWARVSPVAALGGSKAHGENVLKMAIEDIGRLHAELQQAKKPTKRAKPGAAEHVAEINRLRAWVDDLQSGMHVNCVYCGFRYGPNKTTPVSMADTLKAHVEACPEHPMSKCRSELKTFRTAVEFWVMARFPENPPRTALELSQQQSAVGMAENTLRCVAKKMVGA